MRNMKYSIVIFKTYFDMFVFEKGSKDLTEFSVEINNVVLEKRNFHQFKYTEVLNIKYFKVNIKEKV